VVVDDLEQLAWLGDTTGLHLGPDWHVVEADLEGTRADQLSLHGIAEEEGHHTCVYFVLQHPGSPARSLHAKEREGVEGGEDHEDQEYLADAEQLCGLKSVAARGKVVTTDGHLWVFLLQYTGILLKYLLISSGVAVEELYSRTHQLGQLRLRDVLLGLQTCLA